MDEWCEGGMLRCEAKREWGEGEGEVREAIQYLYFLGLGLARREVCPS